MYDKSEDQKIKQIQKENANRGSNDQSSLPGMKILTHCISQNANDGSRGNGSLALFITPARKASETFERAFSFLLDRSGSMDGEPYAAETKALQLTIGKLRSNDRLGIFVFDHNQIYFRSQTHSFTKDEAMSRSNAQRNKKVDSRRTEKSGLRTFLTLGIESFCNWFFLEVMFCMYKKNKRNVNERKMFLCVSFFFY